MHRFIVLMGLLIIGGSGSLVAQELEPAGTYNFTVAMDGGAMVTGAFEITCTEEGCSGYSTSDVGSADIVSIEVEGPTLILTLDGGEMGEIFVELTMDGNDFTGVGMAGAEEFYLTGTKVES